MVETTPLHPDTFLSNSDKHRGTHFPSITSDDVCLETGIDVGDGTHIVYKTGIRHLSYAYSGTVDSSVHPTTGFSLRISGEGDIRRWLHHVPLLNPVQISKFLVWSRFSECPSRLFLRQCVGLLLGDTSPGALSKDRSSNDYQTRFLERVDLLTLFILHNHSLTMDDLAMKSVARSKEATRESIRRLKSKGLLRNSQSDQQTSYALSSNGSELIERFEEAWKMIRHENPRIFPLKSYQCLSVPRINAEESPRLANLNETLESSA